MIRDLVIFDDTFAGHHREFFLAAARALLPLARRVFLICPDPAWVTQRLVPSGAVMVVECPLAPLQQEVQGGAARRRLLRDAPWPVIAHVSRQWAVNVAKSLVFFPDIRCVWRTGLWWLFSEQVCGVWSGSFIETRMFREDPTGWKLRAVFGPYGALFAKNLGALASLDEHTVGLARRIIDAPVAPLADFCSNAPTTEGDRVVQFRHKVAGRKAALCIGALSRRKGIFEFLAASSLNDDPDTVYCLIGKVTATVTLHEQSIIKGCAAKDTTNLVVELEELASEGEFNAYLATAAVIVAVYRDFPGSSNLLAKSALHRKPIVVQDGGLMADRVRRYRLGLVVGGAPSEIRQAVSRLTTHGWSFDDALLAEFQSVHSIAAYERTVFSLGTSAQAALAHRCV